jgi:spermidine/putrescine transport system permease protein
MKRSSPKPIFLASWSTFVYGFLYLPILVVIAMSFNDSAILSLPFQGLTLRWYDLAFHDMAVRNAFLNSLKVAIAATFFATLLGLLAAFAIHRYQFFGKNTFRIVINLPILLPGVVTGVAMLAYFSDLGLDLSLITIILGHIVFGLPVALGTILTRLEQFPISLEEAAYDLGARPAQAFWDVLFPYIRSAVISGALLASPYLLMKL